MAQVQTGKVPTQAAAKPFVRSNSNASKGGRLYVKAVMLGYKRSLRNQYENVALLRLEGVNRLSDTPYYIGKKCVYVYRASKKTTVPAVRGRTAKKLNNVRAVWGKICRPHGNSGVVRARFTTNLPASAIGQRIRVMLYPSRA